MMAIDILDEKKREVAHQNIEAWFTLFHAKQYLLGSRPRASVERMQAEKGER